MIVFLQLKIKLLSIDFSLIDVKVSDMTLGDIDPGTRPPGVEEQQIIDMVTMRLPDQFRDSFDDGGVTVTNVEASINYPVIEVDKPYRQIAGSIEQLPSGVLRIFGLTISHGVNYIPQEDGYAESSTTFHLDHHLREGELSIGITERTKTTMHSADGNERIELHETIDSQVVTPHNIGHVLGIIQREAIEPFLS